MGWGKQISILILKEPVSVIYHQECLSCGVREASLPALECFSLSIMAVTCSLPQCSLPPSAFSVSWTLVLLGSLTMMLQSKRWWFIDNEIMVSFWGRIMQSQICRTGKDFRMLKVHEVSSLPLTFTKKRT